MWVWVPVARGRGGGSRGGNPLRNAQPEEFGLLVLSAQSVCACVEGGGGSAFKQVTIYSL